jgi:hypothetical protein
MTNIANLRPPWKPGESGNPDGRPARAKLSELFVHDVNVTWGKYGAKILDDMAKKDGRGFAFLCSKLIPQNVVVDLQARQSPLDDNDLAILRAIKEAIPNAGELSPEQVFQHTLAALRAYGAVTIEST